MKIAPGARIQGVDADGTFADIVCGTNACTLNTATEALAGTPYPPNRVLTIVLKANPTIVQAGTNPGLQLPANINQAARVSDLAPDSSDLLGSPDRTLREPVRAV